MADSLNIWNSYGLNGNPFNPDPLSVYGGELPIQDSFIGRELEFKQISKMIHSNKTTRILVHGEIGIGKTTFANYVRYEAIQSGYFTPLGELGIQYNWNPEEFMFNTISFIYSTIDRNQTIREKFDKDLKNKLDILFGVERGKTSGVGGSAFGFGVNRDKGYAVAPAPTNSHNLKLLLQDVLNEIQRLGYKGTIIHFNNLEQIQEKGEKQLLRIMNGIRDFLQVEGVHFLFVSETRLFELFHQMHRVEDIFKVPILLKPFSIDEIKKIIHKRMQILRISKDITPIDPLEEQTLKVLYALYSGNLRGILRSLDCAMNNIESPTPVKLSSNTVRNTLCRFANGRFLSKLTRTETKVLFRIIEKKETTNKRLCEAFNMLPQNVAPILTKLRDVGAIRLARSEGQNRFYASSQEALWLKLDMASPTEIQTAIKNTKKAQK